MSGQEGGRHPAQVHGVASLWLSLRTHAPSREHKAKINAINYAIVVDVTFVLASFSDIKLVHACTDIISVEVTVAIKISRNACCFLVIDPDSVGLSRSIRDHCIEVAVAVEVTEGD